MSEVQQISDKKCGYCGFILPQHYNLLNHSCFQPFNKDTDSLNVDENLVVTVISRIEEFNDLNNLPNESVSLQEVDTDELLIYYVSQKPALFDHRIPTSDRSTLKKNALWQEICNSLGGALTLAEVKKRWRYLRDCFIKAKKKEHTYTPSGSAANILTHKKSSFRFYEQMKFLDDVLGKSPTCTSLPSNTQNEVDDENILETSESSMSVPPLSSVSSVPSSSGENNFNSNRKRKLDRSSKELHEEFHETVINTLRETKQPDGVDGFLLLLGEGLRKLPYRERTKLEMKYLAMLMEEQDKLHDLPI